MSISIRWFPPSWFQIKKTDKTLYVDPAYLKWHFKDYPSNIVFSSWPDEIDGLPEELEKADFILVTHAHKDHVKLVTVNRLKRENTIVLAPKRCAKELGKDIRIVEPGEKMIFGEVGIEVTQAYNTEQGQSTQKIHHRGNGVGYLMTLEGKTVYHAGDTDLIPEMEDLGEIDVALLPIGGTFTMDVKEAICAALAINPKVAIPMHMKDADPQEFKEKVEAQSGIKVVLLKTGEVYDLG